MNIKNFTQFINLIASKGALHLHPSFSRLQTCISVYGTLCSCGGSSNQEKSNKHAECNRIYRESIGAVDGIKAHLFNGSSENTISFFIDESNLVKTLGR